MTAATLTHAARHAVHHPGPAALILIGFAAITGYVISLYLWPWKPCPRCKGSGVKRGSTRKRFGPCRHCHGARHVQRPGSRYVARTVLSIRGEIARERQRRRDAKTDARTDDPRRQAGRQ